ncbi:hypothetical protein MNBD_ALPHA09-39 [hydrothermal vent metagenome]|uniref:PAS domain-containing protein n=1 Tax=hydrothermal vent metagenome TaxID=652676 RepID=A0A3B0UEK6_9ZZZZ
MDQTISWRPGVAAGEGGKVRVIREPLTDVIKRYQSEDRPRLAAHFEEALSAGGSGPIRFRVKRRNGATIYIESVAISVRSADGKLKIDGLMRNCRDDIVNEQAISGLNSLMQQLMDHSHHATLVVDGNQKIVNYNNNVHRFLAIDPKTDLRKSKIGVLSALRNIDLVSAFEEAFHGGHDVRNRLEVDIAPGDRRCFRLWAYRWFRPNGRPGGVVIRIENDDAAKTEQARNATQRMMDALPDIFLVCDAKSGIFRFANRAARERLGLRLEDLATRSAVEMVFARDLFRKIQQGTKKTGVMAEVAASLTSYAGPQRPVMLNAAVISWDNEPSIVVLARPATQTAKAQGAGLLGLLTG